MYVIFPISEYVYLHSLLSKQCIVLFSTLKNLLLPSLFL